jgi:hypothetical protein
MRGSRHKFTPADDSELLGHILTYGGNNWGCIADQMTGGFTARQCRERWRYHLDPDVCATEWTAAEDAQLLAKVEQLGPVWTTIAQHFHRRCGSAIRNRYKLLMRRKLKEKPQECAQRHAPSGLNNDPIRPELLADLTAGELMALFFPSS